MAHYLTRDGDVLDRICWAHYGRESAVVQVLEANRGIGLALGPVLPAGLIIELPLLRDTRAVSRRRLW